MKTEVKTS